MKFLLGLFAGAAIVWIATYVIIFLVGVTH